MSSNKAIPSGIEITTKDVLSHEFCNVTNLSIKNKSNGIIKYNFGGVKFELEENEEDNFPSPNTPMNVKIEFTIPSTITTINIKIKTVKEL